jgi:ATP-dependent Lon protease
LLRELHLGKYDPQLNGAVIDRLAGVSPRDMRKTLLDSLGYAVAAGRDQVKAEDIRIKPGAGKARIGF